jgi:hypothetical protein
MVTGVADFSGTESSVAGLTADATWLHPNADFQSARRILSCAWLHRQSLIGCACVCSASPLLWAVKTLARRIVDGDLRLKAARTLGFSELPVIVCADWSPEQLRGFRLLANRSANWAEWDLDAVGSGLTAFLPFWPPCLFARSTFRRRRPSDANCRNSILEKSCLPQRRG